LNIKQWILATNDKWPVAPCYGLCFDVMFLDQTSEESGNHRALTLWAKSWTIWYGSFSFE